VKNVSRGFNNSSTTKSQLFPIVNGSNATMSNLRRPQHTSSTTFMMAALKQWSHLIVYLYSNWTRITDPCKWL